MNTALHFSSDRQDWGTPPDFFARADRSWGPFDLDVCATTDNARCARYFSPDDDGLARPWSGRCWMNPPYGRAVPAWLAKAVAEAESGNALLVAALIASRTGASWWHSYVMRPGNTVLFIQGRLKFEGAPSSAPFDSALVIITGEQRPLRFGSMKARV